jgi:hypothetical protein
MDWLLFGMSKVYSAVKPCKDTHTYFPKIKTGSNCLVLSVAFK